jgi:hypothetical protein
VNRNLYFGVVRSGFANDMHLWQRCPPAETVVQVETMNHMMDHTDLDKKPLPGGLYAIVIRSSEQNGDLMIVSVPRSLTAHPRYGEWQWHQSFPFDVDKNDPDYMRLLMVKDHVTAAVLALADLSDTLPVVVDDGWLC